MKAKGAEVRGWTLCLRSVLRGGGGLDPKPDLEA